MCSDHSDRKAREDHRNEARFRALSPVQQAHSAADRAWTRMQDAEALRGGSPLNRDPREIAGNVVGHAQMAQVEERPSTETWARIVAYGLAGWCSAAKSEELDISSGDVAA